MTHTPKAMRDRAAVEREIYGQTTVPEMLDQGAASGEEVERLRAKAQKRADLDKRIRFGLQFMVDSIAKDKAEVAEIYPALFRTIQARRAEMGNLGGVQVFGEIARDIIALMDGAEKPPEPTEYERKVAQMKEDFPNGI